MFRTRLATNSPFSILNSQLHGVSDGLAFVRLSVAVALTVDTPEERHMPKFLAIYTGSKDSPAVAEWNAMNESERTERQRAGIQAWIAWGQTHKAAIIDAGGPAGKTKRISKDGISDIANAISGYTIVEAESHEAAAKLFVNHPHFTIFPGDAVEVMPLLPIPGLEE